jgi:CTP:phosphocholine cytidylyltransferase-like protein
MLNKLLTRNKIIFLIVVCALVIFLLAVFRERPIWNYSGDVNLDMMDVYRNNLLVNEHIDKQKVLELLRETTGKRSFNIYGSFSTEAREWTIMAGDGNYRVFVNIVGEYSYWTFMDGVNYFDISKPEKFKECLEKLYEESAQTMK